MAKKAGGLGKGLDALFLDNGPDGALANETSEISISDIQPDRDQPRQMFDDESLAELAGSITQHGVLQPILVRPLPSGGYRIVAGERRWRASRLAGKTTIPAIVRNLSDVEAMTIALIENLQREDLNPIDEALGYRRFMEASGYTQEQVASAIGRSRSAVANAIRLLTLPDDVIELVKDGKLSTGHAKAVLSITDPDVRSMVAQRIVNEGLTVREAEKLCSHPMRQQRIKLPKPQEAIATEVELSLRDALGVEVHVNYRDGKGTLAVDFYSKEQLVEFANKLGGGR